MLNSTVIEGILTDVAEAVTAGKLQRGWLLLSPLLQAAVAQTNELTREQQYHVTAQAAELAIALKKPGVALDCARQAESLTMQKGWPTHLQALALRDLGRLDEAVTLWERVLAGESYVQAAYQGLGSLLLRQERYLRARQVLEEAVRLWPRSADLWLSYGLVQARLDDLEGADAALRTAMRLGPAGWEAPLLNLAWVLRRRGGFAEALQLHRQAVEVAPESAEAHWNLATSLLSHGLYREGFAAFEWRFRRGRALLQQRDIPLWDGQAELSGKRILVVREQGVGDALQMLRFAAVLAARGAEVIWEAHAGLESLCASVTGVHAVVGPDMAPPEVEYQVPVMSLPCCLRVTDAVDIPLAPYLTAPAGDPVPLTARTGRKKIGLVWRGNPSHEGDAARSIALPRLGEMLRRSSGMVDWVCLQRPDNREAFPPELAACFRDDLGPWLSDFSRTARALMALDLVISVDTAVLHLAGALGRPVWGLLPLASDWRWLIGRDDSPWYSTLRLFRQTEPAPAGDPWGPALQQVMTALEQYTPVR